MNWAIDGGKGYDVWRRATLSIAAATAGSYGASGISELYGYEAIGYWDHKFFHAG